VQRDCEQGRVPARSCVCTAFFVQGWLGQEALRQTAGKKHLLDISHQQDPSTLEEGITKRKDLHPDGLLISKFKSRMNRLMELCGGGITLTHWLFTQKLFCCVNEYQEGHLLIRFLPSRHTIYQAWRVKERAKERE